MTITRSCLRAHRCARGRVGVLLCGLFVAAAAQGAAKKPLRALLITGGCCHNYTAQKSILPKGVSARADVIWTVVQQGGSTTDTKIPVYQDPNWADGFDVIVHNECFAGVRDKDWVENILKPHRAGTPAVLIHCAMHCYRTGSDMWFEFCGVQSPGHGAHYAFTVDNLKKDNAIMKGFGDAWTVPKGELYHTVKLFPTATPLAHAKRNGDKKPQVCIWTNQYGKARVFGTTIGHYNETMAEPKYLDMITRGILWAAGRLGEADIRKTDAETDEAIKALVSVKPDAGGSTLPAGSQCCGEGNLVAGKATRASTEESSKNNFAKHAVDGNLGTRWCAAGGNIHETWQVDLGQPEHVKSLRIHWERDGSWYRYKVDASADGNNWKNIVDQSKNTQKRRVTPHKVDAPNTRHLRVTFLGNGSGLWGSFFEFEAYAGELPDLPKGVDRRAGGAPSTVRDVQAPAEFDVRMFGTPPEVNYPVCLTAAATGEVFVGVDTQGSLGKKPGGGKVLRCIDVDGDGVADEIVEFAKMDHPRGLIFDHHTLWVLHPPYMTVYFDDDRDGKADREKRLIDGISTDYVYKRGADHTTNGISMGIDGWIYIAVGDFGFTKAVGADGTVISRRGGGVVRIRPDGGEMEIYCWGLRNFLDVGIDPYMNMFSRDNTNDGGGWNVRVSHVIQTGEYGYPSLYKNFSAEIMPPLHDYGGGSGCGAMYFHDLRWPEPYADAFYSCDWGTSKVYRHNFPREGATFQAHQEVFLNVPRPTDIAVDGSGRMYVSSWKNGGFSYSHPNVGFVAQIVPVGFTPKPFPDLETASDSDLVRMLASPSAKHRLHSQRAILRRGPYAVREFRGLKGAFRTESRFLELVTLAADAGAPLYGRVAAIFTLKQLRGVESHPALVKLASDPAVREFALRALTDRKSQLSGIPIDPFVSALHDNNPRVRAAALVGLGRLGNIDVAPAIVPLTKRSAGALPTKKPQHAQPDTGRVLPHLAVRALEELKAADACLAALEGPHRDGALWALRYIHTERAVTGLITRLGSTTDPELRRGICTALIRLYHREGEYKQGWWGTRPDTSGPYFDRKTWDQSKTIAEAIRAVIKSAGKSLADHVRAQLARHKVKIDGLPAGSKTAAADTQAPLVLPKVTSGAKNLIANMSVKQAAAAALKANGDVKAGKALFTRQGCVACHTDANGQPPKGPHLVDIGKRYRPTELIESILAPNAKIAQGFSTNHFQMKDGTAHMGFVVTEGANEVVIRSVAGVATTLAKAKVAKRTALPNSMMPPGLVGNLTPQQFADLLAYLRSLR